MKDHMSAKDFKLLKTEHQIQTEIINWLKAKGWYVQRMNSGVVSADYTYKKGYMKGVTKSRKLWLSDKGTPDLMAFKVMNPDIHEISLIFIEVKRPGKFPTFAQQETMKELMHYGARCLVVNSVEELEQII